MRCLSLYRPMNTFKHVKIIRSSFLFSTTQECGYWQHYSSTLFIHLVTIVFIIISLITWIIIIINIIHISNVPRSFLWKLWICKGSLSNCKAIS